MSEVQKVRGFLGVILFTFRVQHDCSDELWYTIVEYLNRVWYLDWDGNLATWKDSNPTLCQVRIRSFQGSRGRHGFEFEFSFDEERRGWGHDVLRRFSDLGYVYEDGSLHNVRRE